MVILGTLTHLQFLDTAVRCLIPICKLQEAEPGYLAASMEGAKSFVQWSGPTSLYMQRFVEELSWNYFQFFQKDLQRDSPTIKKSGDKMEIVIQRKMHHWHHLEYSLISEESGLDTCQAQSYKVT